MLTDLQRLEVLRAVLGLAGTLAGVQFVVTGAVAAVGNLLGSNLFNSPAGGALVGLADRPPRPARLPRS